MKVDRNLQRRMGLQRKANHLLKKTENKSNYLVNIPAPMNVLSSIGSDESNGEKTVKDKIEASSNRDQKEFEDNTEALKSGVGKEQSSVVLSDMGISMGGDEERDIAEVNQKLKKKLKIKQEELEKAEFEMAKAKSEYIKIMREL